MLVALLGWVLTMIALPIVRWTAGEAALQRGIVVAVLIQAGVVLLIVWQAWGARRTLSMAAVVAVLSWMAEAVGSATGFPFGEYDYTQVLQPQLAGVPLLIPLAWLMMLPPAWAVAGLILAGRAGPPPGHGWRSRAGLAAASALAFTAWDLYLDPQMVAWNFWVWDQPGAYFGIPLQNFLGWLLVSGLVTAVVGPHRLPTPPLVTVYVLTWLLQFIGQLFFWGLPGPALVGGAGMGAVLALSLYRSTTPAERRAFFTVFPARASRLWPGG